jgi:hypothetical protein
LLVEKKNFLEMENSCCCRYMGIVLEYVLDAYQWTDRYALSNADTQWNREEI